MKNLSAQNFSATFRRLRRALRSVSTERLWMLCVALFLLLTLGLAAHAMLLFITTARESGPALPSGPAIQTLDRAKMKSVLDRFDQRTSDFRTLPARPPALPDPR